MEQAFAREMKEELGSTVSLEENSKTPVGMTVEYRHSMNLVQFSYVFLGKIEGEKGQVHYTEKEMAEGAELVWISLEEGLKLIKNSEPTTLSGKFIVERDLAILKAATSD